MSDALGDRMKRQYEDRTRVMLPRRTYTIVRVDGKAFHTLTRKLEQYDSRLVFAMDSAAKALCTLLQGARFAYTQSDEISVLLTDFDKIDTDACFDNNLQKIVSVGASIATAAFNWGFSFPEDEISMALFDGRAFTIPDPVEVENYFIWRQQDAVRNSVQSMAQGLFGHKRCHGKNGQQLQELIFAETGKQWSDLPTAQKRGRVVRRQPVSFKRLGWTVDAEPPTFTQDRDFLQHMIPNYEV